MQMYAKNVFIFTISNLVEIRKNKICVQYKIMHSRIEYILKNILHKIDRGSNLDKVKI